MMKNSTHGIKVGVIRWDYLNGGDKDTNCELKSLSPRLFHDKVPYFLSIDNDDTVSGHENDQDIIDEQIVMAEEAGIHYWAFISGTEHSPDSPEHYALDKYLSSRRRAKLCFSIVLHKHDRVGWPTRLEKLTQWMSDPLYMGVMNGRPLVYVFSIGDMEEAYGTGDGTVQALEALRSSAAAAGLPNPYLVLMCSCSRVSSEAEKAGAYGFDAISAYSYAGKADAPDARPSYQELAEQNRRSWREYAATGRSFIPLVSFGRNEEPRLDNPPPWGGGHGPYWNNPTAEEAAEQLAAGMDFAIWNKPVCEAETVLCYAWNEYTEGGWICPTHAEGRTKLEAIARLLNKAE